MKVGQLFGKLRQRLSIPQTVIQRPQAAYTGKTGQLVVEARQAAHARAGRGHRQAVAIAGYRLVATRPLLADQFANPVVFIKTYCLQGVAHQARLAFGIAQQGLGRQYQVATHGLLVVHRAAHR